jgi:hypothetical protein
MLARACHLIPISSRPRLDFRGSDHRPHHAARRDTATTKFSIVTIDRFANAQRPTATCSARLEHPLSQQLSVFDLGVIELDQQWPMPGTVEGAVSSTDRSP